MAAGCPVLISPMVNLASDVAAAEAGQVATLGEEPFATAISSLLLDGARRHRLAESGRSFALRYDWAEVAPRLATMLRSVAFDSRTGLDAFSHHASGGPIPHAASLTD